MKGVGRQRQDNRITKLLARVQYEKEALAPKGMAIHNIGQRLWDLVIEILVSSSQLRHVLLRALISRVDEVVKRLVTCLQSAKQFSMILSSSS